MPAGRRIGLHVSAAGGVENAPDNAKAFHAECFQFFSRSPRGGVAPAITADQAALFRTKSRAYGLESYIHTPYYVNFASKNKRIYHGSITAVREELERGTKLGVKYVMTHLGSAKDWIGDAKTSHSRQPVVPATTTPVAALMQAIEGLAKIYEDDPKFTTRLLLEISAGAGAVLGDSFEELAALLKGLGRHDVHICLDTCHLFATGYDLRTAAALHETMRTYTKFLPLSQIKLVHANDSKVGLGERKDRHEHIGQGKIGAAGFKALLAHPAFQHVNFILETPHDEAVKQDLVFLKRWRTINSNHEA